MTADPEWIDTIRGDFSKRLRTRRVVFVHVGALHGGYFEAIFRDHESALVLDVEQILADRAKFTDLLADVTTLIIRGVEALASPDRSRSLGALREVVNEAASFDIKVCLLSRLSKFRYPPVPGSSIILLDSSSFVLPLCVAEEGDIHGLSRLPAIHEEPHREYRDLFAEGLSEVSVDAVLDVEQVAWDSNSSADDLTSSLSGPALEELEHAGFLYREPLDRRLLFAVPSRFSNFRLAVADVIAESVLPPYWGSDLYNNLFAIERALRASVRTLAMSVSGDKWRRGLLSPNLETEVLKLASRSRAVNGTIDSVRDPLEWLSLDELLSLITSNRMGCLGLDESVWSRFRAEVVPIRNRVGHMRLTSEHDAKRVRYWKGFVAKLG